MLLRGTGAVSLGSVFAVFVLSALACAGVNVPNVDNDPNIGFQVPEWSICIKGGSPPFPTCNPGGAGTPVGFTFTFANPTPSKDGSSMRHAFTSAVGGDTNDLVTYKAAQ